MEKMTLERIESNPKALRTKKIFDKNKNRIKESIANGIPVYLICEELGISKTTFYTWKKFYPPLQEAISEGEIKFFKMCGRSLNRLISHRKSKTKEVYVSDSGSSEKVITRDKEPDLSAIKYSMEIRERRQREELREGMNIVSEDDLRKLSDEELIKLMKEVEEEVKELEEELKGVVEDEG